MNGIYESEFNDVTVESLESWNSEYGDHRCDIVVWSDCIVDNCEEVKEEIPSEFEKGYNEGYDAADSEKATMRNSILALLKRKGLIAQDSEYIGDLENIPDATYSEEGPIPIRQFPEDPSRMTPDELIWTLEGEIEGIESIMSSNEVGESVEVIEDLNEVRSSIEKIQDSTQKLNLKKTMVDYNKEIRRAYNFGITYLDHAYSDLFDHIVNKVARENDRESVEKANHLAELMMDRARKIIGRRISSS